MPNNYKGSVSDRLVEKVNEVIHSPEMYDVYKNNLVSYNKILAEGRYKIEDYLNAVMYVSYKLMDYSNLDAYARTFPDRMQSMASKTPKEISSYVAAYNRNKLVNSIYAEALIPSYILNQSMYQKALNTQYEIMNDVKVSPKTRSDAANSILTHLKPPEIKKVELDIGVQDNNGIADLRNALREYSNAQLQMLNEGVSLKQVAESKLITVSE